jgi:hypothetical protein
MKPSAIYSKSGKGVQEASGKTSLLKRADRTVLSAIDGRATLAEVAQKVGKSFDAAFEQIIAQLDKEGFVREVTAAASSSQSRPAMPTVKPAAKAPAAKVGGADDLDFTTIMPALKPAARPAAAASSTPASKSNTAQESALYKAREEAEAKAQAERERLRQEVEAKARAELEAKARADAEKRIREEAAARAKAEIEAKVRAARDKAEAEQRVKLEAERKIREEAERTAREEAERALREAEALRQRLEEERRAREEAERKRRDEEERRRKEEEARRAREEAERKAREEAERKVREEAERKRREEEERKRREEEERRIEEEARRLREEIEAKAREAAERARREEEDRLLREKEEQVRRAKEAEEARMRQARELEEARGRARQREREQEPQKGQGETRRRQPSVPAPAPAAAGSNLGDGSLDALMADLDSFSQREDEERRSREAADSREREDKKLRAQEEAERRMREELAAQEEQERQRAAEEALRREEEERRAREEAERKALEEAERRVREAEEQRRQEAEARARKSREAARAQAAAAASEDDIGVTEKDLDMSEVRRDEAAVAREARKAERKREREARQRNKDAQQRAKAAAREDRVKHSKARRPIRWGRPVAMTLFLALVLGIGALHVLPLPMDKYERAASEALGRPVTIGVGRLALFTGARLELENVLVGGTVKIASVYAYPELGSLMDDKKAFRRIVLKGLEVPQAALGEVVGAKLRPGNFKVGRIFANDLKLTGPVPLPTLEADVQIGGDGAVRSVTLRGPESLNAVLTPAARGQVEFDVTAAAITLPFAPDVSLSSFAMKGIANRQGMNIASWGGAVLDGVVSGSAQLRWNGPWQLEGSMTARNINAASFAPALLSEGKAEGIGRFYMSAADPAKMHNGARIEGSFAVGKGALGTFDLSRVLQTSGKQYGGRTLFTELSGHGVYDRGAIALRNVNISAGALSAGASADIAPSGALVGRVVADIRTTAQPLRATLTLGGTLKEPQVRN